MSKLRWLVLFVGLLTLPACLQESTNTESEAVFQLLWEEFDRYYAFFEYKNIDWDEAYQRYHPQATGANEQELLDVLCRMAAELEDGHVNIFTPDDGCGYDFTAGAPSNAPVLAAPYLYEVKNLSNAMQYGRLRDHPNIGYVRINRFSGERIEFSVIDQALEQLQDTKALIIDLRDNGGGSDRNSEVVASRFATERRMYRRFRYRNGPEHDQFTEWIEDYIGPAGPRQYTQPVALLTNRRCFSTTEDFVLAMKRFDHVQTVGDTTGGGSGNPIFRELPNGWVYRLSHWQMQTAEGEFFEGIGLPPDHLQWISQQDSLEGRDAILERAVQLLD
jgi:hypothetical protein